MFDKIQLKDEIRVLRETISRLEDASEILEDSLRISSYQNEEMRKEIIGTINKLNNTVVKSKTLLGTKRSFLQSIINGEENIKAWASQNPVV